MNTNYYEMVQKLEDMRVDPDYIQGWVGGFLGNPQREEQRLTDPYSAGYEDGENQKIENASNWIK